jgi:hypothetical protein
MKHFLPNSKGASGTPLKKNRYTMEVFMFRKIILSALFIMLCAAQVHAERTLQVFTTDELSPKLLTPTDDNWQMQFTSQFGGSDRSAFSLEWRSYTNEGHGYEGKEIDVPMLEFDAPDDIEPGDELVGLAMTTTSPNSLFGGAEIPPPRAVLYLGGKASPAVLPKTGNLYSATQMQPFRIPLQMGSTSKHFILAINIHEYGRAAFANLRLVRANAPATAPVMPGNESSLPPVGLNESVVRQLSGNDFAPQIIGGGADNGSEPITFSPGANGVAVNVFLSAAIPPRIMPLISVDDPGVTCADYAIAGDISYAGVQGDSDIDGYGYLEMESDFADGSSHFTRTLADSGLLREIHGRSGSRAFLLPFHSGDKRPTRIRINLVMSGRGEVDLNNLRLVQYSPPVVAAAMAHTDSSRTFSPRLLWIPAMVLPFFSLVLLMEPLVRRGKGRRVVMTWIWTSFVFAQIAFAWCMAAWGHGVARSEFGPPLLISVMVLGCTLFASRRMARRYRDAELKRMQLMDAV